MLAEAAGTDRGDGAESSAGAGAGAGDGAESGTSGGGDGSDPESKYAAEGGGGGATTKSMPKPEPGAGGRGVEPKWLESRCKLVRADFVSGIDTHWSKSTPVKNIVLVAGTEMSCWGDITLLP